MFESKWINSITFISFCHIHFVPRSLVNVVDTLTKDEANDETTKKYLTFCTAFIYLYFNLRQHEKSVIISPEKESTIHCAIAHLAHTHWNGPNECDGEKINLNLSIERCNEHLAKCLCTNDEHHFELFFFAWTNEKKKNYVSNCVRYALFARLSRVSLSHLRRFCVVNYFFCRKAI